MKNLEMLKDVELVQILNELDEVVNGTNITVPWVTVPIMHNDKLVMQELEMRDGRITKPIFVLNLQRKIKEEMARRFMVAVSNAQRDSIELVV